MRTTLKKTDEPTQRRVLVNGIELAYFEWGGALRGRQPTFLLAHATGFHARCWDQVIRHLGDRHVIAVDQRGHGRSEKTEIGNWNVFGQDLAALARELDLRDVVGVGHSMGGHALVDAAASCPRRFRRLILIDPVIGSPEAYGESGWTVPDPGGEKHPTAKRKNRFASPDEMFERFEERDPYVLFDRAVLRDYCNYGVLPAEDGAGFVLACPPEIEAGIYMSSRSNPGVHDSIRALHIPVLLLRAKEPSADRSLMDFSTSPTWPGLVGEVPKRSRNLLSGPHALPSHGDPRIHRNPGPA